MSQSSSCASVSCCGQTGSTQLSRISPCFWFLWLLSANVFLLSKLFVAKESSVHTSSKICQAYCCKIDGLLADSRSQNNVNNRLLFLCMVDVEDGLWDHNTLEKRREDLGLFLNIPWTSILEGPWSCLKEDTLILWEDTDFTRHCV